jgi:hypothetical protein
MGQSAAKDQFITVAFGHDVVSPGGIGLDVKYGDDSTLLAGIENEKVKEALVGTHWGSPVFIEVY